MGDRATVRPRTSRAREGARPRHLRLVEPLPRTASGRAHLARRDLVLLWASAGALTAIGLVMVLSAGSVSATQGYDGNPFWYFQRQAVYAVVGIVAAVVVARLRPAIWKVVSIPLLALSALAMFIAAHPASGTSLYGASRWIDLGPLTIQPSEFAKLGLVAFTATILAARFRRLDEPRQLLLPLAPVVAGVALLGVAQSDMGTTVILVGSVLIMLFAAGVRLRYLGVAGLVGIVGSVALIAGEAYRRTRFFDAWLDPWSDPQRNGYQLIQGLIAFGSGGWFGTGLGSSRAKWDFLPNAHSDFIFAVIGEELGFVGALVAVLVFGLFILAGIRIAVHSTGTFERLLAAGITGWIGLQAIINLGAVTVGGTALVVTLVGVGVLASIARTQARPASRAGARP
jgi:cell division protein FtsW